MDKDIKGFKAFLLSKGAYTSYKENLWQFNRLTIIELMGSLIYEDCFEDMIIDAFDWEWTPEGANYWNRINDEFLDELKID